MFHRYYTAYGLTIDSEIPLSAIELENRQDADLVIRYGRIDGVIRSSDRRPTVMSAGELTAYWPEVAAFSVRNGREIVIEPDLSASESAVSDWVQSSILSIALHQRGLFVLHASAVVIEGRAVAFAGDVGQGKSTTASAFHAAGYPMLTDDLVVVDCAAPQPMVLPGYPHVKLLNETAEHFGVDAKSLKPLDSDQGKGIRRLSAGYHATPVPLGGICILEDAAQLSVAPMPPQFALRNLICHAFVARLTEFLERTGTAQRHFRDCTTIVGRELVWSLKRPRDLMQLPNLVQRVRETIGAKSIAA
ncbi:MAG: hypothetical protein JO353_09880 [Phycisphaerae bacterium]|nr:hypothetical protein [Phycisphaerae bacterium]